MRWQGRLTTTRGQGLSRSRPCLWCARPSQSHSERRGDAMLCWAPSCGGRLVCIPNRLPHSPGALRAAVVPGQRTDWSLQIAHQTRRCATLVTPGALTARKPSRSRGPGSRQTRCASRPARLPCSHAMLPAEVSWFKNQPRRCGRTDEDWGGSLRPPRQCQAPAERTHKHTPRAPLHDSSRLFYGASRAGASHRGSPLRPRTGRPTNRKAGRHTRASAAQLDPIAAGHR